MIKSIVVLRSFAKNFNSKEHLAEIESLNIILETLLSLWGEFSVKQGEIDRLSKKVYELEGRLELSGQFLGLR